MFLYEHLSDAVFCVENNNYSASKKGKGNNNHDNDNQGHAIDNSESGKQAERNAVQESPSTGAYGMAVDDDTLNKGNINDEGAMRKAKKAEYNKRAREKKRQVLLDDVDKSKKAEYNNRTREKKRQALLDEVDKAKMAEYNNRARGKKREALLEESNEEESNEGEDGIHYHAQSDHHLKLLAAQEQEDHERRVDNRRIYALQPNRMNEGGEEETKQEDISDGNVDCNNDNQLLALANGDPPLIVDVDLIAVPPREQGLSLRNKPKGRPKKKSTHNSGRVSFDDFDESLVPLHIIEQRSICPHCEAKIWPGEEKDCCDSGARVLPVATWPDTPEFREYIDLFKTRGFVNNARRYNALFAFTSIVLTAQPRSNSRTHNLPTCSEIAVLFSETSKSGRHILLHGTDGPVLSEVVPDYRVGKHVCLDRQPGEDHLFRIKEFHSAYDPLHYPLLFPTGTLGWSYGNKSGLNGKNVSLNNYARYHLYERGAFSPLHASGPLLQVFAVDNFAKVENQRLGFLRDQTNNLRSDTYRAVHDAVSHDVDVNSIGKRIVLPSSYTGGPRYMRQRYLDAMAIVRKYGRPDLFITVTCNPKWVEIDRELELAKEDYGFKRPPSDRPDLLTRMFRLKLLAIEAMLTKGILGRQDAHVRSVEFQKRGLPHAHILVIFSGDDKIKTTADIDSIISAEIPDKEKNPRLHKIVTTCMIHKCSDRCLENGKCKKNFPKAYCDETSIGSDGYPLYRRRRSSAERPS
ncbi:hypothetical protein AeRB84_015346, partial [Aphanomyces euteiches]